MIIQVWFLAADVLDKSRLHCILTEAYNLDLDISDKWSINIQFKTPVPCLRKIDQFFRDSPVNTFFYIGSVIFFNSSSSFCAIKCTNQPNFSSFIGRIINSILFWAMILPYFLKGREGGHFRWSNSFLSVFVSLFLIGQRFSVTVM